MKTQTEKHLRSEEREGDSLVGFGLKTLTDAAFQK